jgi:DNA (cytosine-5)-methyltransferase 1
LTAYYNEIDPYAAQWLRNLIKAGHIAPGDVDERSIVDVGPGDVRGYSQCHFFAGIGVWSLALRRAGVADTANVWSGSCPCQPFSAAGKGGGFDDERHLWPAFHHLIKECGPGIVIGEQVASKDGLAWLDLVQSDMEGEDYAFGAVDMCAAGFGAPHIRQRLYWMAKPDDAQWGPNPAGGNERDGDDTRRSESAGHVEGRGEPGVVANSTDPGQQRGRSSEASNGRDTSWVEPERLRDVIELGNAVAEGLQERIGNIGISRIAGHAGPGEAAFGAGIHSVELADANGGDASAEWQQRSGQQRQQQEDSGFSGGCGVGLGHNRGPELEGPCPTNGFWRDADWLLCRDGKWRPVEPGTFPLAHGAPARVGRLRAYGNAINAEQATDFIRAIGLAG